MLLARRGLLHLVLLYLACTGAVSGQEQATVPADSVAGKALAVAIAVL